jgi:hypothetical protein
VASVATLTLTAFLAQPPNTKPTTNKPSRANNNTRFISSSFKNIYGLIEKYSLKRMDPKENLVPPTTSLLLGVRTFYFQLGNQDFKGRFIIGQTQLSSCKTFYCNKKFD